jgi:hypothetical protein
MISRLSDQPAARVALELVETAGRPKILHGAIVAYCQSLLICYVFNSCLRLLDMG